MPDFSELEFRQAHEVRDVVARYGPADYLRLRGMARIQGVSFPAGSPVRVMSHRAYSVDQQYEVEVTGPDGQSVEFNTSERALDNLVERHVDRQHWTRLEEIRESTRRAFQSYATLRDANLRADAVRTPEVTPVREPETPAKPGRTAWQWLDEDAV